MLFFEIAILISILVIGGTVMIFAWKHSGSKGKVKADLDNTWKHVANEREVVIKDLIKENDRQRGRANRALQMLEGEEGEPEEEGINPEILAQISKEVGIPAEQISMMVEIPQIKKLLGKDPNKTIMQYAPLLKGFMNKKSPQETPQTTGM